MFRAAPVYSCPLSVFLYHSRRYSGDIREAFPVVLDANAAVALLYFVASYPDVVVKGKREQELLFCDGCLSVFCE